MKMTNTEMELSNKEENSSGDKFKRIITFN